MGFFSEYKAVKKILSTKHPVIFYAESKYYQQYFRELIDGLCEQYQQSIYYITSDENDPILLSSSPKIKAFYVHWWLAFLFSRLKAAVVIVTMPDLDNYIFKRSKEVGEYIYVFHAAVSTHQQYTEKAFYNYTTIFCTGDYQVNEIRIAEQKNNLLSKNLVNYGYPLIDAIKERFRQHKQHAQEDILKILIAPSWYEHCIFETCLQELVHQLASLPYQVYIRPHPEYIKRRKKKFEALKTYANQHPNLFFDHSQDVIQSLIEADLLITDRSGIALEYTFGTHRPVLFIDTPPKVVNPNWEKLGVTPIENKIRSEIGLSISSMELTTIAQIIDNLIKSREDFCTRLQLLEKQLLFNSSLSYQKGVEYVWEACQK